MKLSAYHFLLLVGVLIGIASCGDSSKTKNTKVGKAESKHHLNIPNKGIESLMETNSQKIIEGTDGSVIISIGEMTRKKVDISLKRGDKILDGRLMGVNDSIQFDYADHSYTVLVKKLKKPILGEGKVELSIH